MNPLLKHSLTALAILTALSILFFQVITAPEPQHAQNIIYDTGDFQVHFCPDQDCEAALLEFVEESQERLDCAFFDIGLESLQEALDQKAKQIPLRIVTDNDYLHKYNRSFIITDRWGLMHNKFCISDSKRVLTGSMNPTNNGAHKNNNNLLIINSTFLAQTYTDEFEELHKGIFKKGERRSIDTIHLKNKNITLEVLFCPEDHCAAKVRKELLKANHSISFMTFSFTHNGLANILLLKNLEGIEIQGVMEARQVTKYSVYQSLEDNGLDVKKDENPQSMHHKVFIIDNKTVLTGSMNPTGGGDSRNDENLLIIKSQDIAQQYLEEFEKVKSFKRE